MIEAKKVFEAFQKHRDNAIVAVQGTSGHHWNGITTSPNRDIFLGGAMGHSTSAVIRSGIGVLCLPDNPKARDQYLKRREIRRSLVSRYEETPPEVELTQEEVDLIKNDPSFG